MNALQTTQIRRRDIRWHLLKFIDLNRPQGCYVAGLLPIIRTAYADATEHELRRELGYLEERELVHIHRDPLDLWMVALARYGIDVVEYTVECDPGISRPSITQS